MADNDTTRNTLSDRARAIAETTKAKIDEHVDRQSDRLSGHLAKAEQRFEKLPGVSTEQPAEDR